MASPHVCFAELPQYAATTATTTTATTAIKATTYNNNHTDVENDDVEGKKYATTLQLQPGNDSPSSSCSLSTSPTPRYERNMGFFQQLSRRFGLRSNDDLVHVDEVAVAAAVMAATAAAAAAAAASTAGDDDANSSSTDSYSSTTAATAATAAAAGGGAAAGAGLGSLGSNHNRQCSIAIINSLEQMSCASSETSSTNDIDEHKDDQDKLHKRKSITRASFCRLHRRSTSSLRRAFESLTLTSRSLSCSGPSPPPAQPSANTQNAALKPQQPMPLKSALKSASNIELHKHKSCSLSSSCSNASARSQASSASAKSQHTHSLSLSSSSASSTSSSSSSSSSSTSKSKPPPQRILRQPVSYTYLKGMSGLPTQRVPRSSVCCQHARR